MRTKLIVLATLLALSVAAVAPAATSKSFKGGAANAGTVKFRLSGSK